MSQRVAVLPWMGRLSLRKTCPFNNPDSAQNGSFTVEVGPMIAPNENPFELAKELSGVHWIEDGLFHRSRGRYFR